MHPYRVFVSYSREDKTLVEQFVAHLQKTGLRAVWDRNIRPGQRFSEVIKHGIAHAHVFVPMLTAKSVKRPWVHQETGYAMGLDVPVLPVAVGHLPSQMLADLQVMQIGADLTDVSVNAFTDAIENLMISKTALESESASCIAASPEMRAELLARYTREALLHGAVGPIRQAGALSSFCLPREPPDHDIWRRRDGKRPRSQFLYERLHHERLAFEDYATTQGCDLVLDPSIQFKLNGPSARRIRLQTLLNGLEDDTLSPLQAVIRKRLIAGSLTICGDWFCAESVTPRAGEGYQHTVFTWHAPTVLQKIREFDQRFAHYLKESEVATECCRKTVIHSVKQEIAGLLGRGQ